MAAADGRRLRTGRGAALAALVWAGCVLGACEPQPGSLASGGLVAASIDPASLNGMDAARLSAMLGEPELHRQEPPAEVWQYRTDSCVLDVFLYPEGGQHRVVHSEARPRTGTGTVDAGRCLGALAHRRPGPHSANRPG